VHVGDLIILADDRANADGVEWKLVDAMRARLDIKLEAFSKAATATYGSGTAYDQRVKEKKQLAKEARKAIGMLNVYIENAFFADAANINHMLLLDQKFPTDSEEISHYLTTVCAALDNHDNATYPLPVSFTDPIYVVRDDFAKALIDVNDFYEDRRTAFQTRNLAFAEFKKLLHPIRM